VSLKWLDFATVQGAISKTIYVLLQETHSVRWYYKSLHIKSTGQIKLVHV